MPTNLKTAIRPYQSEDCAGLFKISTDDVFTWLPYGPFETEEAMRTFYDKLSGICELFTVFDIESRIIQGIFALKNISDEHKKCEIGHIWYGKQYQRTHVNTEAMFLAFSMCFEERGFRRVSWKCDDLNLNSKRCVLRLGFHEEGVFLNDQIVKGKNKNTAWFAITDKEWPHVKQNFLDCFFSTAYRDARRPLSPDKNGHASAPDTNIRNKNLTIGISPASTTNTPSQTDHIGQRPENMQRQQTPIDAHIRTLEETIIQQQRQIDQLQKGCNSGNNRFFHHSTTRDDSNDQEQNNPDNLNFDQNPQKETSSP